MKYMLMFMTDDEKWDPRKPEIEDAMRRIGQWWEEHAKSGQIKSGEQLKDANTATTIRQRDGKVTVTDGPFSESKESVGGYAVIDVKDLDEAIALAKSWPALSTIEIRPVVER